MFSRYNDLFIFISIQIVLIIKTRAQISPFCQVYKVQNPSNAPPEVIFHFECFPPAPINQVFPTGFGSNPNEFTKLLMSPNTFTTLPTTNICQYTSVYLLDVSFNQLTSITGLFQTLKCLVSLTTLIMSNNYISSPLMQSDFDDTFSQQLVSLDLSNNQIPSIDTNLFFKTDGTSRFINLKYLNLGYNRITQFDMLMPLTMPNSYLNFMINSNPINTLVNQLGISYTDNRLAYPVVNNRVANITNNILTTFGDSNLIQYGLKSQTDLLNFLNKIANYDLRQFNNKVASCECVGTTNLIPTWYQSLLSSSLIILNSFVSQFTCVTYNQNIFLVVTSCGSNASSNSSFGFLSGTTTAAATTTDNSLYALFVIPIVLLLLLIICCNLRPINKCLFRSCHTTCFTTLRPGEHSKKHQKKFDATIIYSKLDEEWVEDKLEEKSFKIIDYSINSLGFEKGSKRIEKEELESIKLSKRIVLVISKNFMSEVWVNEDLQRELKFLNSTDKNCSFIVVDRKNVSKNVMNQTIEELQEYSEEGTSCYSCKQRTRYNFSLKNVEIVNGNNPQLKEELRFLMPFKPIYAQFDDEDMESTSDEYNKQKPKRFNVFRKNHVVPQQNFVKQEEIIHDNDSESILTTMSSLTSASQLLAAPKYEPSATEIWRKRIEESSYNDSAIKFIGDSSFLPFQPKPLRITNKNLRIQDLIKNPILPPLLNISNSSRVGKNGRKYMDSQSSTSSVKNVKVPMITVTDESKNRKKRKDKNKNKLKMAAESATKGNPYFVPIYKSNTYNDETSIQYVTLDQNYEPSAFRKNSKVALPAPVYPDIY